MVWAVAPGESEVVLMGHGEHTGRATVALPPGEKVPAEQMVQALGPPKPGRQTVQGSGMMWV